MEKEWCIDECYSLFMSLKPLPPPEERYRLPRK
jgi:hypothetical protein